MGHKARTQKYDETLAVRIRRLLPPADVSERRMFGGICFMVRGHMCVGIVKDSLMARVGPERYEESLAKPHTRPMDFTGTPLRGFVYVDAKGLSGAGLARWLDRARAFAESLPPRP